MDPDDDVLTFVTPEEDGQGLYLRVTKQFLSGGKSRSQEVHITWEEGRRLLVNLTAILNYRHASLERRASDGH